jgi:hypothetical protein
MVGWVRFITDLVRVRKNSGLRLRNLDRWIWLNRRLRNAEVGDPCDVEWTNGVRT